jgi:hypothetical protein
MKTCTCAYVRILIEARIGVVFVESLIIERDNFLFIKDFVIAFLFAGGGCGTSSYISLLNGDAGVQKLSCLRRCLNLFGTPIHHLAVVVLQSYDDICGVCT